MNNEIQVSRRPILGRKYKINNEIALKLVSIGLTPNQISVASAVFALTAGIALIANLPILAAAFIGLRLYCNLIDGMMAIEGGKITKSGILFNEIPDRISDTLILVALGYVCGHYYIQLGWLAALLAVITAYIRTFGASLGMPQDFGGPMAKPHRMFVVIAACVACFVENILLSTNCSLRIALVVITIGTLFTCVRRILKLRRQLENAN